MTSRHTAHPLPRPTRATALAAATQGRQPQTSHLVHETADPVTVARHSMIIQPALHNTSKPAGRFANGPVHAFTQLLLDRLQRCSYTLRHTVTMDRKPTVRSRRGTLVSETKKIERFRSALATLGSPLDRITTELDQARLAFVKSQAKLGKALPEFFQTCYRFGMALETNHEVVRVTDNHHIAAAVIFPPPFDPQVEHVVQVHVRKQR